MLKPTPKAYQKIWAEIAEVFSSATNEKKLSRNRAEQRRTGRGATSHHDLTEKEERVLALMGIHPWSARQAAAEREMMPPQPAVRSQARPPSPEGGDTGPDSPDDPTSEEPQFSPINPLGLFSTDDSADFEEPASPGSRRHSTPRPSSAPQAIPTSTLEVPGPSTSPQGTPIVPRTAPTPRRFLRRGRSVPRAPDERGDMAELSSGTVDIGQQIPQTLRSIS
uniref:uncharacterized protein n=1 Tax=Pristiophorus japonicus TaxID=55135 RepID=UPI00398F5DD4